MNEIDIDVSGKTCPTPLVEARKAVRKTSPGDVIRITGTHAQSRLEIPMAAEAFGLRCEVSDREPGTWMITIFR